MARNSTAKGKIVRRFGVNIFGNPKYDRLLQHKPAPPGEPKKKGRVRQTEFGRQLNEKQKLKFAYGLSEKQFRNIFFAAKRLKGVTGTNMLVLLETRLDNVLYRFGVGSSRTQTRQMISHGHIYINDRRVNIPSYRVRTSDVITVKENTRSKELARRLVSENNSRPVPPWVNFNPDEFKGNITMIPTRDMIPTIAEEQLVVEYYSK